MINMLAKAQKSWVAKLILGLTALSFMSLFGVSGYLSSVGRNKPVIKVDDIELKQSEFQYMLQREQAKIRNLLGDEYLDDENAQAELIQKLAARELSNAIVDRTAEKNNISISNELIRYAIMSRPEFQVNGVYDQRLMKKYLSDAGISEGELIQGIRRDIERQIMLGAVLDDFYPPRILNDLYIRLTGQKRVFSYITVDSSKIKVDRKISDDEVEQYYSDFAPDFVEPERRDADFILISNADIERNIEVTADEIEAFYQDNISDYEQPETRKVLQMMFEKEQDANKAFFALKSGKDFMTVAKDMAGQTAEDTDFGFVSKDMLIEEVQDEVFALRGGTISKPIQSENGWHIMKVEEIVPMVKMPKKEADADITKRIKEEKLYDEMYKYVSDIEDKVGEGATLADIAKQIEATVHHVEKLAEDGSFSGRYLPSLERIVKTADFVDAVFSYNTDEVSQAFETEDGFVLTSVTAVYDAREKTIDEVRPQIEKMWEENEKAVIAQEQINDVMHDLEEGDNIYGVAKRFGLKVVTTKPMARGEASGDLDVSDVISMFHEDLYIPKLITKGTAQTVVLAEKSSVEEPKLTPEQKNMLERQSTFVYLSDLANTILNDFARDYDVRVKYRLMGLSD